MVEPPFNRKSDSGWLIFELPHTERHLAMENTTPPQRKAASTVETLPHTSASNLPRFFHHPLVGFVGTVISIISLALAFYFYFDGIRERHLTYYINPVRTAIVKQGQFSELSVEFSGKQITNNLTVATIAIWNSGKEPILRSDILKPIRLSASQNAPIYKATLSKFRDVTAINLLQGNPQAGELELDWKILERNDGAVITVIYGGDETTSFSVEGTVIGQRSIDPATKADMRPMTKYLISSFGGFAFSAVMTFAVSRKNRQNTLRKHLQGNALNLIAILVYTSLLIYTVIKMFSAKVHSPFGF